MTETRESIGEWADEMFGETHPRLLVSRAMLEMSELVWAFSVDENRDKVIEEACDIIIVLCRFMTCTFDSLLSAASRNRTFYGLENSDKSIIAEIVCKMGHLNWVVLCYPNHNVHENLSEQIAAKLVGLISYYEKDPIKEIDAKMEINRRRDWVLVNGRIRH